MLRLVKYISIFILFFFTRAFAQSVQSISVSGNRNFGSDEIIAWSGITPGQKMFNGMIDSVKKRLAYNLGERGYYHSAFEGTGVRPGTDTSKISLHIELSEGAPTYVGSLETTGLDSSSAETVTPLFKYLDGRIFNKYDLSEVISEALTYFENNGRPFARIIIESVYFYGDAANSDYSARIRLRVDEGVYCRIDKIEISGNNSTADYVITRELRIETGEEYSQKLIDELPERLNRLGFFEPVQKPDFYLNSKNQGILLIKVKEKQTNNFDGIIGYIPSSGTNQGGYLTGLVNVSLRNLFGTGRAAAIRWQQYDKNSQDLELKYLEPWIFGYPFNLNGDIFQRKQDSSYVQRKLEGSIEYLATENFSASFFISSETIIPTQGVIPAFTVFNSNSVTTGINLKIDTRDDPYSPTQGILFLNSYSFSRKKITGPAEFITPDIQTDITLQRFSIDISGYYSPFQRQVAALGLHGRELRGSFFEISDLYRLGGTNTLRGYREDQFLGNRIFWSNLEYRFLLSRRTFVFPFIDTGYYLMNDNPTLHITRAEGFKIGYGLGLNIETGLGELGVSFALAKGDSFSLGKIHFGLVNEF